MLSQPILLSALPAWLFPPPRAVTLTRDRQEGFSVLNSLPKPSGREGVASATYYFTTMQQRRLHSASPSVILSITPRLIDSSLLLLLKSTSLTGERPIALHVNSVGWAGG